ncbi:MAG: hypothetical protein K2M27_00695 [Muribaculaceae bacterium]|nr:hypothetical protein [Muribaculaceae bacterium]
MGLLNRIKRSNVIRNVWTQMAQITVICGLILATGTANACIQRDHYGLAFAYTAAICAVAIVFISWLGWFIYVILTKRHLVPMHPEGYMILDCIELCLFLFWIISLIFNTDIGAWVVPVLILIWIASGYIALKYKTSEL